MNLMFPGILADRELLVSFRIHEVVKIPVIVGTACLFFQWALGILSVGLNVLSIVAPVMTF